MACIKMNQIQIDQHYICISIYIQGREFLTDILTKSKKKKVTGRVLENLLENLL